MRLFFREGCGKGCVRVCKAERDRDEGEGTREFGVREIADFKLWDLLVSEKLNWSLDSGNERVIYVYT